MDTRQRIDERSNYGRERDWDRERDYRDNRGSGARSPRSRSVEHAGERRAPDTTVDSRNRDMYRDGRSLGNGGWDRHPDRDSRDNFNQDRLPNFSTRPDKYRYQEWRDKPDVVPKGPSYYEHDTRGDLHGREPRGRGNFAVRGGGRGRGGPISVRPFGGPSARGGRGIGGGYRGRGTLGSSFSFNPRNKWSPSQWEHDKFETSPDRKSEQDNKPSSTTGNK